MFSILITEKTKCINCASVSLNAFLFWRVFPHAYSIDIRVHKTSLFPRAPVKNFRRLVETTLEGPVKMGWRETGFVFYSGFFLGCENWHIARRNRVESQLHNSHLPPRDCTDVKEQSRTEQTMGWGDDSNFSLYTKPSQMILKKKNKSHATAMWNYTDLLRK